MVDLERHYAELAEEKRRLEDLLFRTERMMVGVRRGMDELRMPHPPPQAPAAQPGSHRPPSTQPQPQGHRQPLRRALPCERLEWAFLHRVDPDPTEWTTKERVDEIIAQGMDYVRPPAASPPPERHAPVIDLVCGPRMVTQADVASWPDHAEAERWLRHGYVRALNPETGEEEWVLDEVLVEFNDERRRKEREERRVKREERRARVAEEKRQREVEEKKAKREQQRARRQEQKAKREEQKAKREEQRAKGEERKVKWNLRKRT